ncbi:MAG TPA: hypothetical protein VLV32_08265 [Burkholderiales bacterium]|nr:hypothetical protein [Burkholderiales bacterium]
MKSKTSRHDLQAAHLRHLLARDGCPICFEIASSTIDYFFWFLQESYGDPGILKEIAAARGFCLKHGRLLEKSQANSYQLSYVFSRVTSELRSTLAKYGAISSKRLQSELAFSATCPACRTLQGVADRGAFFLQRFLENQDNIACYGQPGRLCFPHLQSISGELAAPVLRHLLSNHERAIVAALGSLDENRAEEIEARQNQITEISRDVRAPCHLAIGHFLDPLIMAGPDAGISNGDTARDPVGEFTKNLRRTDICAICLEEHRAWQEWFAWLESAVQTDADIGGVLPTCPEHVWTIIYFGSPILAIRTIRNVLNASRRQISNGMLRLIGAAPAKSRSLLARLRRRIYEPFERLRDSREIVVRPMPCPACTRSEVAADRVLDLLFRLLEERRYRLGFENGYGLCMRHFSRALAQANAISVARVIASVEGAKLARLGWELEETLRKESWSARPETKGTEQTAWRRAIDRYCGF